MIEKTVTDFTKPLAVLIVEDNKIDRRILESMLQEKDEYTSLLKAAETLDQALLLMDEFEFEVMILDLNLPDSHGEDTLSRIATKNPRLAVVVNTGAYEDQLGLKTLSIGAQDFLVKGKYTAYLLNKAMHYAVERKRFEVDLKEAYEKLKETQTQLIHAEKMRVIGALASGVAHEVKNPLATIIYGITYLEETLKTVDEKINSVLKNIREASFRADRIITDLLDFARLRQIRKEKQNINEVIVKALVLVHHELERKHIGVVKHLEENLPEIEIDINKIEQVLVNLMINAVNAMERDGTLTVESAIVTLSPDCSEIPELHRVHFSPKERVVCISVNDTGSGIAQEDLEKIFDPFYTTRRASGGMGLGLSVSRNIIDIHEGSISIANAQEKGASAKLHLKIGKE